jgi:lysozyme family protein
VADQGGSILMGNRIDAIIARVIARESAEFTNHPHDSGGPTKYGITQGALSEYLGRPATVAEVQNIDAVQATEFYWHKQVRQPKFDGIVSISELVGAELIDTGTLTGTPRAGMFLQRCLNALNLRGTHYPDINVDGDCGPRTREALRAYIARRGGEGERVLVVAMNSLLAGFLIDLAERRPKDETFVYGWLKERVVEAA